MRSVTVDWQRVKFFCSYLQVIKTKCKKTINYQELTSARLLSVLRFGRSRTSLKSSLISLSIRGIFPPDLQTVLQTRRRRRRQSATPGSSAERDCTEELADRPPKRPGCSAKVEPRRGLTNPSISETYSIILPVNIFEFEFIYSNTVTIAVHPYDYSNTCLIMYSNSR